MASFIPLRVGIPSAASPPETGRSTAILTTSPLAAAGLVASADIGVSVACPAAATVSVGCPAAVVGCSAAAGVAVGDSVPHALRIMLNASMRATIENHILEDFMVRNFPPFFNVLELWPQV